MRVTFLGTGSAMPTGERMQTGLLVESGDESLLIDCGSGALHALARTRAGYEGPDTLLLTHHHLDHVSDVLPLLKARWLAGEEAFTVVGPPGTAELVTNLLSVHDYMQDRIDLTLRDVAVEDTPLTLSGLTVEAAETVHSMHCHAYRMEPVTQDGPVFVYSGDGEATTDLLEFADGAAILAHDCSFPDGVDVSNHPTPSALGQSLSAADAEVGRVYLTHLYPHTDGKHEEMLASIEASYDGDVRFAHDGLTVEVS